MDDSSSTRNPKDLVGDRKPPLHLIPPAAEMSRCSRCGEFKPITEFNRERRRACGRRSDCRACQKRYNQSFRERRPLYCIWNQMLNRCFNSGTPAFRHYGARGITVCDRWLDYDAFVAAMSPRPSPRHTIDRIDNDGDYSPDNCRWALHQQQMSNQRSNHRIAVNGVTRTLAEWIRFTGISGCTVQARLYRYGWDEVAAVTTPARKHRKRGSQA